jgi:TonB-dependent starch-binding outer membrane protein SusC
MYISIRMPSRGILKAIAQPDAAAAPKPKTIVYSSTCKTLVRVVRLTVIIMLCGLFQVSARTSAQTRISIKLHGATLEKVFSEIEKRSGYTVFYNTEVLKAAGASLVSLDLNDATIDDVMHQCLKGLPLEFTVQDKTIFVKKEARRAEIEILPGGPGSPKPSTFSGIVKSETGVPLMGATVFVVKTKKSAVTDNNGEFTMKNVPDGEYEVVISYIGFENYRTKISVLNHEAWLAADLKQSMSKLDETVVKGYYNTTNRLNTGDVTTVKGEDIEKQPVTDPILALDGRVPGLYIQQTSGVPGQYPTIMLRGKNSIANGNNPLYIVDGVPYSSTSPTNEFGAVGGGVLGRPGQYTSGLGASPFNDLNPADIESIEVLKDADATAIYGSRGANGVILITTKKGKAGSTRFDVNAYSGAGKVDRFMHFMNTQQYLSMRHEAFNNDGLTPDPTYDFDLTDWDTTRHTNWQKVLIGNTAKFNNLQGALSGGNSNTQFRIGAGYSNQGTVFPGGFSDQKAMGNINLTHASQNQRLHAQFSASYVYDKSNLPTGDLTSLVTLAPDAPAIFDGNGNLNWQVVNGSASWSNPLSYLYAKSMAGTDNLVSSFNVSYRILPGLQVKGNFGYTHLQNNQSIQYELAASAPPVADPSLARSNNFATTDFKTWIIEPQIIYETDIAGGKLNALIGNTFQQNHQSSQGYNAVGFASDALLGDPEAAQYVNIIGYSTTLYHYAAGFGRLSYDWHDKYLINFTARRDGSSRFGPGKQFGNFASAGVGWIFSKENFVQQSFSFLSFGKLRASYGTTGNDQISDYQFLSTYSPLTTTYQGVAGLNPTGLTNPNFAWEQVNKLEGGIELGFLHDRLLVTGNYYRNRTNDQLVGYSLPYVTGFPTVQANLPALIQNNGWEFTLNSINIRTSAFSWSSSFNLTVPKTKLLAFQNLSRSPYAHSYTLGASLFSEYLYHYAGINDTTGVAQYTTGKGLSDNPSYPQDIETTKPITQHWYGGLENSFSYKGFGLSFLFQFVNETGFNYIATMAGYYAGVENLNMPTAFLNHWKSPTSPGHYGMYSTIGAADPNAVLSSSDKIISNTSFFRLKNLAFSYGFSKNLLSKIHLQSARVYFQAQNLFLITHNYLGFDPENGGGTLPPLRMLTGGLQIFL